VRSIDKLIGTELSARLVEAPEQQRRDASLAAAVAAIRGTNLEDAVLSEALDDALQHNYTRGMRSAVAAVVQWLDEQAWGLQEGGSTPARSSERITSRRSGRRERRRRWWQTSTRTQASRWTKPYTRLGMPSTATRGYPSSYARFSISWLRATIGRRASWRACSGRNLWLSTTTCCSPVTTQPTISRHGATGAPIAARQSKTSSITFTLRMCRASDRRAMASTTSGGSSPTPGARRLKAICLSGASRLSSMADSHGVLGDV